MRFMRNLLRSTGSDLRPPKAKRPTIGRALKHS